MARTGKDARKAVVSVIPMISIAVLASTFAIPNGVGYAAVPLSVLQEDDEYAIAQYVENRNPTVQTSWGRGAMATITIENTCNRGDHHEIANWVSVSLWDEAGVEWARVQGGFVQVGKACDTARPFAQLCRTPCEAATGVYEPAIYGEHPMAVPDDGLAGIFRIFLTRPGTGANPDEPCIARLILNLPCPIAMTIPEYNNGICESMDSQDVECATFKDEVSVVASGIELCEGLTGYLVQARAADCQAVEAARLILDRGIGECQQAESFLDSVYDVPVCLRPKQEMATASAFAIQDNVCSLLVYYDGAPFAEYPAVPCESAKFSQITYEALPIDPLDTHLAPGSTDQPALFTSWKSIGTSGISGIPNTNKIWRLFHSATCPPYESKWASVSSLVNWATIGPNIDSSNIRCDFLVSATPGFGIVAATLATLTGLYAYRRLSRR